MNIVAIPPEEAMRPYRDFYQGVPGSPAAGAWLPFFPQPQRLLVACARRNDDIDRIATGQGNPTCGAVDSIQKIDLQAIAPVIASHSKGASSAARKQRRQNVIGIAKIREARSIAIGIGCAASIGEVSIVAALRLLLAGRVDLAPVKAGTLLLAAKNVISRRDILKLPLGFLVAGVEVRMKLFGQFSIGLLDILLLGMSWHTQQFVGIGVGH